MAPLEPPSLASRSSYARKFQDPAFWQPYVDAVLRRHNLPWGQAIVGAGGTFPTFLVGAYVVKFFGRRFDGAECFEIERSAHPCPAQPACSHSEARRGRAPVQRGLALALHRDDATCRDRGGR